MTWNQMSFIENYSIKILGDFTGITKSSFSTAVVAGWISRAGLAILGQNPVMSHNFWFKESSFKEE